MGEKEAIASYIWNLMEKEDRGRPQWYYTKIGTHAYIAKIYRGSNWSVAAFSKENTFLSDIRAKEYPDGQMFSSYGRKWCMRGKSGRRKQHVSGRDFGNRRFLEE